LLWLVIVFTGFSFSTIVTAGRLAAGYEDIALIFSLSPEEAFQGGFSG
jgi:hypothetical protein